MQEKFYNGPIQLQWQWPYTIFKNDSFALNFPISRENRNLEPITIRYDVGHPVEYIQLLTKPNL